MELVRDAATLLLPASRDDIAAALAGLKISRLLNGFRGNPAGDRNAVIDAIAAVADFALAHEDSLLELDVNPLLVLPEGFGAVAVDVLVRLRA